MEKYEMNDSLKWDREEETEALRILLQKKADQCIIRGQSLGGDEEVQSLSRRVNELIAGTQSKEQGEQ